MDENDKQPCESGQPNGQDGGILDLDFEDADKIIKAHSSNLRRRRRKKYTLSEDMIILKNVVRTHSIFSATGTMLWQAMEDRKITDHSWESMKSRYLKYILPAIDTYDIPNSWKWFLTGDTSKPIDMSDPDINPSISSLFNNNQSPKKKGNSNLGLLGDHPPQLKKKKSSNIENVIEKTSSSSSKRLSDPNCSAITSSTITPSPPKSPLTNTTSTPKHKDGCSKFVNIALNLEEQIDEYDSREMSEDILEPNKSVDVFKVGSFSTGSEDEFDINLMKMSAENKTVNSITDKSTQIKPFNASDQKTKCQNSSVMVEKTNRIADDDSAVNNVLSQTEETIQSESSLIQNKSVETSDVIGCDDEFDQNLIEIATERISPTGSNKLISRRKTKSSMESFSKRHAKASSLRDFVATSDISDLSMDETEESTIDELTKVIEEFHDKYNLNKAQVISILWYFSGNVKNAMQWIEFGSDLSNLQPWSKGEDSLLTSTTDTDLNYLKVKYTPEIVAERNLFFEELKL